MKMHTGLTLPLGLLLACGLLSACESVSSSSDGDCTSHYDSVVSAPTWAALKAEMVGSTQHGRRVASLRTQARGEEVVGAAGDEMVVRVVDLLDQRGRRLSQVDVWRTDGGGWSSGAWSQCID